jgi:hypothetical protein
MYKCLFWLALVMAVPCYAARTIPTDGQLGELKAAAIPEIKIDDKIYRTAPGLRVYGLNNALIMQSHMPQQAAVWFQIEATSGNVWRLWLLNADEVSAIKKRPKIQAAE